MKKIKKVNKSKLKKKIDTLFSQKVREGKVCLKCGKKDNLQCAHIFSRRYMATRWDFDNAIPLCYACHFFWAHQNPMEFSTFIVSKLGMVKVEQLREKSSKIIRYTLQDLEIILENLKNETK